MRLLCPIHAADATRRSGGVGAVTHPLAAVVTLFAIFMIPVATEL